MKLASLRDGGRDGTLVVVDAALRHCVRATGVAPTLQAAIETWETAAPALQALADRLATDDGMDGRETFDPASCAAPLPRAYQFADASAYVNHMALVRKARGADMPPSFFICASWSAMSSCRLSRSGSM